MSSYNNLPQHTKIAERYVLRQILGTGKNSCVYLATDLTTKTDVALKVLDPLLAQDQVAQERFRREAEILRQNDLPQLIKVYDFLQTEDYKILVMEYFPASSLKQRITETGAFSLPVFMSLAKSLCQTLSTCHKQGIIHRDVKPQNILLKDDTQLKIIDFGVSRVNTTSDLTKTGTIIGTPEYMAPECFTTSFVDQRADIFSLGVTFYECLSGRLPYRGQSLAQIMSDQMKGETVPLEEYNAEIPKWLAGIVEKCMQVLPERRYQSLEDVIADLERGEKSRAVAELRTRNITCTACRAELLMGLTFCHQCGTTTAEAFTSGHHSLVLYSATNPRQLGIEILKLFPKTNKSKLTGAVLDTPSVLIKNVDEKTAEYLLARWVVTDCELKNVTKIPLEVRMPARFAAVSFLGLAPTVIMQLPDLIRWGCIPFTLAIMFCVYTWRSRSLLRLNKLEQETQTTSDFLLKVAAQLKSLQDRRGKEILGRILQRYQELAIGEGSDQRLQEIMAAALKTIASMDQISVLLAQSPLPTIKRKLDVAAHQVSTSSEASDSEKWIRTKSELESQLRFLREKQEEYADGLQSLLQLLGTLENEVIPISSAA